MRSLHAGSDGRVWAGTFSDGVSVYDPATNRFTRFRHNAGDARTLAHNRVEGLAEDRDGAIWAATYGGLDRIDPRTGAIDHYRHDPRDPASLADDRTRGILVDRDGRIWVGTSAGVQRLIPGTRRFEAMGPAAGADSLRGHFVSVLFQDASGRIWIGTTDSGAAVYEPATARWHRLAPRSSDRDGLAHFWVYGFAQVGEEIWVATFGGGIDILDASSLRLVDRLRHDATLPSTIADDRIGAILRDRSGVVWVGTWGEGLGRHDPTARAFRELRFTPQQPQGLSHVAAVRAVETSAGEIWVGTNGNGVDVFDAGWHRLRTYRANAANPGALADGSVTCLLETSDGSIWVATLDGTLHRRRTGRDVFERLSVETGLPGGPIRAMAEGMTGELWIASANGLARLDTRDGSIAGYHHDPNDPRSLSSNTVESLVVMADGGVWAGTDSGLNVLDPASGAVTRILPDAAQPDSLPNNWVPDMALVGGRLWVATPSGAAVLTSWDGAAARFESIAGRIGRAPGSVESIVEDASGSVWLGQRLRVDPRTWASREFGPADGCDFRTFFIASRARTRDGALLFGSPEGLLIVRPDAIVPWTYRPRTVITSLRVDGAERVVGARPASIVLPPRTRSVEFGFAALDLSSPDRIVYRHRLDGFDGEWSVDGASRRSVNYTNLAPGSYLLHVEGSNRAHEWSGDELQIAVIVRPAFYQTRWFAALSVGLVVMVVYSAYRLRVRQLQRRSHELERVVSERTAALQEAYKRIEEASLRDPLTGVNNRRFLEQAIGPDLELAIRRARAGEADAALIGVLLDLDHFKSVNDRFGHAAGDAVLVQTAQLLRASVRASDYVVRWGGEEFLVVARFVGREQGAVIAEKIRVAVQGHAYALPDGQTLQMTCSAGCAVFPPPPSAADAISWEETVNMADAALYEAKRGGRNQWCAATP